MMPEEKVNHCLSVTNDRNRVLLWLKNQIGKKVHSALNPHNLSQQEVDLYWSECIKELEKI